MPRRIRITSLDYIREIYSQVSDNWFRYTDLSSPGFNQSVFKGLYNEKALLRKRDVKTGRFCYWKVTPMAVAAMEKIRRYG